jgi:hypothetical protein
VASPERERSIFSVIHAQRNKLFGIGLSLLAVTATIAGSFLFKRNEIYSFSIIVLLLFIATIFTVKNFNVIFGRYNIINLLKLFIPLGIILVISYLYYFR